MDKRLDLAMIESSALAAAIHCAKNGVTFVIDHHASPFAPKAPLYHHRQMPLIRWASPICSAMSSRTGTAKPPPRRPWPRPTPFWPLGNPGHVGLHASFTVGDELLEKAMDLARKHNTGIHMHVAEDKADQEHCQETYGMRVVERYAKAGALELKKSILCHCLHLDEAERRWWQGLRSLGGPEHREQP
jgi:cytosine/adenosine deaminase-related metal-dependent hydrolase